MVPIQFKSISLTSTKCPYIDAAAAITGLTRCVLPPTPCLPSKFLFDVLAHLSSVASMSGFMPRHMLQPDSRHSNPASLKILSRPISSACLFTFCDPGTIMACTFGEILFPFTTLDASIKSSNLELVQEPIKTRSIVMSVISVPGLRPMYWRALFAAFLLLDFLLHILGQTE